MRKLSFSFFIISHLTFVYSCSAEEEETTPPPSVIKPSTSEPEPTPTVTQFTLTVTAGEGGSVTTGGTYDEGTNVTVTATPSEGYEFAGWEGSDSTDASLTLQLNSNESIQALFQSRPKLYYAKNGETVKARSWAEVGDNEVLDSIEYTIVDRELLDQMLANGDDLSKVVTTKVTSLNNSLNFMSQQFYLMCSRVKISLSKTNVRYFEGIIY